MFLCFDQPGSDARSLAADWWGEDRLGSADTSYQSGTRPGYSGLLLSAALESARASGAAAVGAVIEFGTFDPMEAARCLWIDQWLRRQKDDENIEAVQALHQHIAHFFFPDEPFWNSSALRKGSETIDQAYQGLRLAMAAPDRTRKEPA